MQRFCPILSTAHTKKSTRVPIRAAWLLQVQATFAGGLAEHLQAAGGASAAIAASLRESVSQMNSATDRLNSQVGSTPYCWKV